MDESGLAYWLPIVKDIALIVLPLVGVFVGHLLSSKSQHRSFHRQQAVERIQRTRDSYADWLVEIDRKTSVDRQLILRRMQSENPEIASLPEELATRWANEFANVTEEAFRAGHTEQAAFMRLMLLDDDNGRLDTAQAIRTITQSVFKDTNDPSLIAQEYVQAERRQAEQISLFIPRIRSELDNKITEVS